MKCPRCGNEMKLDAHRKYDMHMCYECGYMEGRNYGEELLHKPTNFEKLREMNENELIAFVSRNLGVSDTQFGTWLTRSAM